MSIRSDRDVPISLIAVISAAVNPAPPVPYSLPLLLDDTTSQLVIDNITGQLTLG